MEVQHGESGGGGASGGAGDAIRKAARRKDGETPEERARRHADKKARVAEHRRTILSRQAEETARSRLHKQEELVCSVRFDNTLPLPPVEAKSMAYPFDEDGAFAYDVLGGVSSEAGFLHKMHAELDLGVTFNFVDPDAYPPPPAVPPPMHPDDAAICDPEFAKPATRKKEAYKEDGTVDWMMRSTFMHLDLYDAVYKHADPTAINTAALARRQRQLAAQRAGKGTPAERVLRSFAAVDGSANVAHPKQPGTLVPTRVWEVLPATASWGASRVAVTFDETPADGRPDAAPAAKRARLESALLRTAPDVGARAAPGSRSVTVDCYVPVGEADTRAAAAAAGVAGGEEGAGEPARHLHAARRYVMTVDALNRAAGQEMLALFWDHDTSTVHIAPISVVANLTTTVAAAGTAGRTVAVRNRPLRDDEAEALQEVEATVSEGPYGPRATALAAARSACLQRLLQGPGDAGAGAGGGGGGGVEVDGGAAGVGVGGGGDGGGDEEAGEVFLTGIKRRADQMAGGEGGGGGGGGGTSGRPSASDGDGFVGDEEE